MTRTLLAVFTLGYALAACGGAATPPTPSAPQTPLAKATVAPTPTPAALDMSGVVAKFLAAIPDKYYAIGTVDALKEATAGGALLVDVREPSEYATGHIPSAINVPLRAIAKNLDVIPAGKTVVVYCKSGYRGSLATGALQLLGYSNVRNFVPALPGWQAAKEPVATDVVPAAKAGSATVDPRLLAAVDAFMSAIPENNYGIATVEAFKVTAGTGMTLVDVREPSEYAAGRIPGAINIPIRSLTSDLTKLSKDKPLVLYCASNQRAGMALVALGLLGYTNTRVFTVNYTGWKAAGEKIEQ